MKDVSAKSILDYFCTDSSVVCKLDEVMMGDGNEIYFLLFCGEGG